MRTSRLALEPPHRRTVWLMHTMTALVLAMALGFLTGCLAEDGEPTPEEAATTTVTWDQVNVLFAGDACQGCHPPNGGLASTLLDHFSLTNGSGSCATNGGKLVEAFDKTKSCLWLAVTKQEGSNMFGATFTPEEEDLIGKWINDGAAGP